MREPMVKPGLRDMRPVEFKKRRWRQDGADYLGMDQPEYGGKPPTIARKPQTEFAHAQTAGKDVIRLRPRSKESEATSGKFTMLNNETKSSNIVSWMKGQVKAGKKILVVDDFQYLLSIPI